MMNTIDLSVVVARLSTSADALAALAAALDARATGHALDPGIQPHINATLSALGIRDAVADLPADELQPLLGRLRVYTLTNAKLMYAGSRDSGWNHNQPKILEAAGDATAGFAIQLKTRIAPQLDGLLDRLAAPEAAFLDIGVGVAALSIGMARAWPSLRIVGLDPLPQAIALARQRICQAGLADRIELREHAGETLSDRAGFDLVWLPSVFIPEAVVSTVIERAHQALKPGGWLLVPTMKPSGDDLTTALARLRTAMFGGVLTTASGMEALLFDHGLADVRTLPSPPAAITSLVVGRREP
jgi:2-polyprenyl-3-methyl-5-hydroxy-6-metoxy-1,4-benzoquinol methylase